MKLSKLLIVMIIMGVTCLQAQTLDRITLNSGGDSTNEVSYVIGEIFNFSLADGDIILETGSQGSTENTGTTLSTDSIEQVEDQGIVISYYPNPVEDNLYFSINGLEIDELNVLLFDINGKLIKNNKTLKKDIMRCQVKNLASGIYLLSLTNTTGKVFGIKRIIKK